MNYRIMPFFSALGIGSIVFLLTSCGFRLKNTSYPTAELVSTQIQLQQTPNYGNFYRSFYTLSKQLGVVIVPKSQRRTTLTPDTRLLWFSEPHFNERPLSYSSDGQANYIMIELTLPYEIQDVKGNILSKGPIVLSRPMSISPNALLNNDSQRTLVKDALIQKACIQLLQRLNTKDT